MFVVVRVNSHYDCIEGVDFVKEFDSEQAAQAYIDELTQKEKTAFLARKNYIDNWVDSLEVPELNYPEWCQYLKKYFSFRYVTPPSFKEELKHSLYKNNENIELENFNPPERTIFLAWQLHIMET